MSVSLLSSGNYVNVQRNKLNYEVLNMKITGQHLIVEGWATIPYTQHFKGKKTHSYELEIKSKGHSFTEKGKIVNQNLTKQMSYDGYRKCKSNELNSTKCNYDHKNVGFEFKIPLNKLKANHDYKLYLKMSAKQSRKKYRIPLFYTTKDHLYLEKNRKEYIVQSDFKHIGFSVFGHTLVARDGPSPRTNMIYSGKSCSKGYRNGWFFKQNAVFNNILDIKRYDKKITYFKVRAKPDSCYNSRLRIVEGKGRGSKIAYLPSTHVNYIGNPTVIKVRNLTSTPELSVKDAYLNQYDKYEAKKYATASDKYDGNITKKIKVTSSNVNTRIPGTYKTCYSVTNSSKITSKKCGKVFVKKIPSKRRFVSRFTIHDTELKRWNRSELNNKLKDKSNIKQETIRP